MESSSPKANFPRHLPRHLAQVVAGNIDGRSANIRYRQKELHRLQNAILENLDDLKQVIAAEWSHNPEEVQAEITLALKEIHTHYASLDFARSLEMEYRIANGQDNVDQKRGTGIVYIIPTQHTLFYSVMAALSAALTAGNCIIVEIPQTTSQLASLLRSILPRALDRDTFAITETRPDDEFLRLTFVLSQEPQPDHLKAPPGQLSPCNLRTAAVIDRTANLAETAADLVMSRFSFNGRSPYSPDFVLVNEFCVEPLIELLIKHTARYLSRGSQQAKQIPKRGAGSSLLETIACEESARVIVSGTDWAVAQVNDRNSVLLKLKISERVLLIHTVSSLDDAINFCNSIGRFNATYTFAAPAAAKYVSESIEAPSAWINHVPHDMLVGPVLPFNSKIGRNTRYSTDTFQVCHGQILHQSPTTILAKSLLSSVSKPYIQASVSEALSPLPSIDQGSGHNIGFFEQGFISGGLIITGSLITAIGAAGYSMWKKR